MSDVGMLEEFLAGARVDAAVFALRPDYRALLLAVLVAAYSPPRGGRWPWCTATSAALAAERAWAATGLAVQRRRTRYPPAGCVIMCPVSGVISLFQAPLPGVVSAAIRRRAARTSGPSRARRAVRSSAAACRAWPVTGSRASRMHSAAVVSSRS